MSWRNLKRSRVYGLVAVVLVLVCSLFIWWSVDEEEWSFVSLTVNQSAVSSSPTIELRAPTKKPLVLIFGGDVMLSRTVNAKMSAYQDYAWPFREIASTTSVADVTIFNLESPFLKEADYRVPTGSFLFKANPQAIDGLLLAGTDIVSLANNHMLNMGRQGLEDTISLLSDHGIATVGAGRDEETARQGYLIERDGWKIAFLAYAYPNDNSVATDQRPGIATMDTDKLVADIIRWRQQADLVIILMHAGTEYVAQPGVEQKAFARAAITAGADVVIGHHPHWPQSWEIYQGKPIFYSLGNLVFDQMWSGATSQGLLARLVFQSDLSGQAELIPVVIKDYGQAQLWPDDEPVATFWDTYQLEQPGVLNWPAPDNN